MSKNNGAIILPEDEFDKKVSGTVPGTGTGAGAGAGAGTGTGTGNNLKAYGNFKDWYRGVTGKEYDGSGFPTNIEGIDNYTLRQGMALYNYDQDVAAANSAHQYTARQAAKARDSEMEYSGVLFERMKKYMPMQQKAAGMGKMGIAQTGLNEITNTHMNRRAAITGEYNDTMAEAGRLQQQSIAEAGKLSRQEIIDIYTDKETADKAAADKAAADLASAINVFSANISNYATKEDAEADLAALGLDESDTRYAALLTQIEGHFRNKADKKTEDALNGIIENLNNGAFTDENSAMAALDYVLDSEDPRYAEYKTQIEGYFRNKADKKTEDTLNGIIKNLNNDAFTDEKSAMAALDYVLDSEDPRYAEYKTQIEGYFRNKADAETKEADDKAKTALDEQYLWLENLLMNADTSQAEQIWAANAEDIEKMTTEQKARLNTLRSLAANAEKDNNYNAMRSEVQALMDEYASDDEIKTALAEWEKKVESKQLDQATFEAYKAEILAEIDSNEFNLEQQKASAENAENEIDYLSEYTMLDQAQRHRYGNDVDAFIADLIAGKVAYYGNKVVSKAVNMEKIMKNGSQLSGTYRQNPSNGDMVQVLIHPNQDGKFGWDDIFEAGPFSLKVPTSYIYLDGNWYMVKKE